MAIALEARQHVLDKHQVGFLAVFRTPLAETAGEFHAGAAVVLRKRRIGQHPVEPAYLAVLQDLRVFQGVAVLDGEPRDVVEDHVHVADRPGGAVGVLAVEHQIIGVLALLLDVLMRLDEKAAGEPAVGSYISLPAAGLVSCTSRRTTSAGV